MTLVNAEADRFRRGKSLNVISRLPMIAYRFEPVKTYSGFGVFDTALFGFTWIATMNPYGVDERFDCPVTVQSEPDPFSRREMRMRRAVCRLIFRCPGMNGRHMQSALACNPPPIFFSPHGGHDESRPDPRGTSSRCPRRAY